MRLSWNYTYSDYNDTENWKPRFLELCEFFKKLDVEKIDSNNLDDVLNVLENLEELTRFYGAKVDLKNLEPIMRSYQAVLEMAEKSNLTGVALYYYKIEFYRINALLYRNQDSNRQAGNIFSQMLPLVKRCLELLQIDIELNDEQKLFVGWACAESVNEAIEAYDTLMEENLFFDSCNTLIPVLEYIEPFLYKNLVVYEKVSEIYRSIAGILSLKGHKEKSISCFEKSISILEKLDELSGNAYYFAKSLWVMSMYSISEFNSGENYGLMGKCEKKTVKFLQERATEKIDIGIAKGVMGAIAAQRGIIFQQQGDGKNATKWAEKSVLLLKEAIALIEKSIEHDGATHFILNNLHSMLVGSLETFGVQLFWSDEYEKSNTVFEECINLLNDNCRLTEQAATLIRTETYLYLGMINSQKSDIDKAIFYLGQSSDLSYDMWTKNKDYRAMEMTIMSTCFISELLLKMKEKEKAKMYSDIGLKACAELRRICPDNQRLEMEILLEKYSKKANRRWL